MPEPSIRQRLFAHSLRYGLGFLLVRAVGLCLLPLFTNEDYLTARDFGAWAVLESTTANLLFFATLNLRAGMLRFLSSERANQHLLPTGFFFHLMIGLGLFLVGLGAVFFGSAPDQKIIWGLWLLDLVLVLPREALNSTLQARGQSRRVLALLAADTLVWMSLTILLVFGLGWGLLGMVTARVLASATSFVLAIFLIGVRQLNFFLVKKTELRRLLKYSVGLLPDVLANRIFRSGGRYLILLYISAPAVAPWALAMKLTGTLEFAVFSPFRRALMPMFFNADAAAKATLLKVTLWGLSAVAALAVVDLSFFGPWLLKIIGASATYQSTLLLIPWLALSFSAEVPALIGSVTLQDAQKPKTLSIISMVGAAVFVGLAMMLLPQWGPVGIAMATTGVLLVKSLVSCEIGSRNLGIGLPTGWASLLWLVSAALALTITFEVVPDLWDAAMVLLFHLLVLVGPMRWAWRTFNQERRESLPPPDAGGGIGQH